MEALIVLGASSSVSSFHELKEAGGQSTMVYSKPEVTRLSSSLEAIQSQALKVQLCLLEGPIIRLVFTPNAYDADE
jgi:hypothetical protein